MVHTCISKFIQPFRNRWKNNPHQKSYLLLRKANIEYARLLSTFFLIDKSLQEESSCSYKWSLVDKSTISLQIYEVFFYRCQRIPCLFENNSHNEWCHIFFYNKNVCVHSWHWNKKQQYCPEVSFPWSKFQDYWQAGMWLWVLFSQLRRDSYCSEGWKVPIYWIIDHRIIEWFLLEGRGL